jgi:hypothetical protein
MTKERTRFEDFYEELRKAEGRPYKEILALYSTLFAEAVSLGIFNDDNILEGIEIDIRIAKAINELRS